VATTCSGIDGRGQVFTDTVLPSLASADPRGSCETPSQRSDRTIRIPHALEASLRRKLRAADHKAIALEQRLIARQRRLAAQHIPLCATSDLRTVAYGLVGTLAQRVTLDDPTTHQAVRPTDHDNGAYLFVLRGPPERHRPIKIRTYYPGGLVCGRGASLAHTPGCSPPPGYIAP
jgi:hypothetical protein